MPDALYEEVGCAFVVPVRDATLAESEIATHCRTRLANYKVPKKFFIRDVLPMLPLGKIDKAQLRAEALRLWGDHVQGSCGVADGAVAGPSGAAEPCGAGCVSPSNARSR